MGTFWGRYDGGVGAWLVFALDSDVLFVHVRSVYMFRNLFRRFLRFVLLLLVKEKNIVSVSWKAITWGHPLVIAPYNESVGRMSFDSTFTPISSRKQPN